MQTTEALHRALAQHPGALATVCGARRHTFEQLADRVARLAGALRALGVQAGDRVGILSANSDRYVETFMAVPWAGAAINPVNTRWSAAEIAHALDDCDTRVLLVDDPFLRLLPELRQRSRSLTTSVHAGDAAEGPLPEGLLSYEALIAGHDPVPDAARRGRDLAGVFYTGGTTGFPKGVMLSHDALGFNARLSRSLGMAQPGHAGLHAAPMFHIADVTQLGALWDAGATHVTVPAFTPLGVLQAIERERVQHVVLVPTMVQMLVDDPQAGNFDLSSLRTLAYGGSPISEAVLDRATRLLPSVDFLQIYGMTELAPCISVLRPELHTAAGRQRGKIRSAGEAAPGIALRIVDAQGADCATGEVGEILVRSPGLMDGYWGSPDATAEVLERAPHPGWMHTGDAGRLDEDGFLFIVDRVKDMIVSGGENVYSAEVEQAVARHPAVAACAVIAVPDERWGERVHAVLVLQPGASVGCDEIRAHCQQLIAGYKAPRSIQVVPALPLSGAGKVLKTRLREPHWAARERQVA